MKRKLFNVMTIAALVAALTSFTGCSPDEIKDYIGNETTASAATASHVCLIVSPTVNQAKPDATLAEAELYDSSFSYGYKCVVCDDGNPFLAFADDMTRIDRNINLSERNQKLDAQAYTAAFIEQAEAVQAVAAEKDVVKSLHLAADSLASYNGEKTIVLIDNGISTSGVAAFSSFQGFDVEKAIAALDESDYPDLTNITVVWYSLGSTVSPQEELSFEDLANLQSFWQKYLENAGASNIQFPKNVAVNTTTDHSALPWVSTVDVTPTVSKIPGFDDIAEEAETLSEEKRDDLYDEVLDVGLKFDEDAAHFKPNSYELLDRAAAVELMRPFAMYLKANADQQVLLIGTTATDGSNQSCIEFSKGRAETLKELLVSDMGVDASQLVIVGLGYEHAFHIDDLNEDGTLNETVAPKNRSVIFVAADSEIGRKYA